MSTKKDIKNIFTCLLVITLCGCTGIPKDLFKLSESSLKERQLQSRIYEADDEVALLAAGVAVLQDMGYVIDETEKGVGLITASKSVAATNAGQITAAVIPDLLGGGVIPIDKVQKIRVSFVTLPSKKFENNYIARITFQRIIWNNEGKILRVEPIKNQEIYEGFFEKLSKSIFLEAHKI